MASLALAAELLAFLFPADFRVLRVIIMPFLPTQDSIYFQSLWFLIVDEWQLLPLVMAFAADLLARVLAAVFIALIRFCAQFASMFCGIVSERLVT